MKKYKKIGNYIWFDNKLMKITNVIGDNVVLNDKITTRKKEIKRVRFGKDKVLHDIIKLKNMKLATISDDIALIIGDDNTDICHYTQLKKST